MKNIIVIFLINIWASSLLGQNIDSIENSASEFKELYLQSEKMRVADSIKKTRIIEAYNLLKEHEKLEKKRLAAELKLLETQDSIRKDEMTERIAILKSKTKGHPVTLFADTLFYIYNRFGASMPADRAGNTSKRILKLFDGEYYYPDSLLTIEGDHTYDVIYGDMIVLSISETDALWYNQTMASLAGIYAAEINKAVVKQRDENSFVKLLIRIGLVILVIAGIWLLIWLISYGHRSAINFLNLNKDKWLRNLSYKDYTFLSAEQELKVIFFILNITRWFFVLLLLYLVLPLIFSIFPFTRGWAGELMGWVWSPFKGIFIAIWNYLPNLFSIIVIYLVMKYFIRFVRYIFSEIEAEKLNISGFHTDWAMPTFTIVRFLLYAFMFVLIFPYLPGSDSEIFKGVSVFIGILFSLGSSTAIANMIAGLVITYMRPFRIGDRIKLGDMTGVVIEKTLLVTRLRTIKNEEITIPNSSVLSGNTINYSVIANTDGLIIHTTITIGYDVPWRQMHQALIDAALKTELILKEPQPFVLQTALDDFYVSYQINAYIRDARLQVNIISELHKNIQDICNERGIEILSPHYRAQRDGNSTTIPADYLSSGYKAPSFRVEMGAAEPGKE